jgi:hypothetical protein
MVAEAGGSAGGGGTRSTKDRVTRSPYRATRGGSSILKTRTSHALVTSSAHCNCLSAPDDRVYASECAAQDL